MSASAGADVRVEHAGRRYGSIEALRDASLHVAPGELLVVTGRSGSGKSTLLNLIGGLDQPTSGRILIDGRELWREPRAPRHRRELVGFVFQQHHLLVNLTARANVEVALIGAGVPRRERREIALRLLEEVGLAARADHEPAALSGGERQRVAIARALANEPRLLLADEPTGAVDSVTSQRVLDLLGEVRARRGMTVIVVSYDPQVGERADRMVTVTDGLLMQPETDLSTAPCA
ncbi:MAG TPA: ABC transporter ATP-binding protein [Solirubrobacteraceae bacterium]|nr:ABC transporter ATP-binding protein [Solirubrobacteraceae bacterium]